MDSKIGSSDSAFAAKAVSRIQLVREEEERQQILSALAKNPISSKICYPIVIEYNRGITSYELRTKEISNLLSSIRTLIVKKTIFINHENIFMMYCPTVGPDHAGTMSILLMNTSTLDKKIVVEDHPISEAAVFYTNWCRSVPNGQSLTLQIEVDGSSATFDTMVGLMRVMWDEEPTHRQIYTKDVKTITLIVPETDPVRKRFSRQTMEGFIKRSITPGDSRLDKPPLDLKLTKALEFEPIGSTSKSTEHHDVVEGQTLS
jgi:hypothetical protein